MRRSISQREARRMRKRIDELEAILRAQRNAYSSNWPSSVVIARLVPSAEIMASIMTARKLDHAVIAVPEGNQIAFFADRISRSRP